MLPSKDNPEPPECRNLGSWTTPNWTDLLCFGCNGDGVPSDFCWVLIGPSNSCKWRFLGIFHSKWEPLGGNNWVGEHCRGRLFCICKSLGECTRICPCVFRMCWWCYFIVFPYLVHLWGINGNYASLIVFFGRHSARTQVEDAHQAGLKEEEAIQIAPWLHCLKAEVLEGSFQSFRTFFVPLWLYDVKTCDDFQVKYTTRFATTMCVTKLHFKIFSLGPSHHDLRSCCKPLLDSHCMRQSQHLLLHAGRSGQDIGLCSWTPSVMTCLATLLQWASLGMLVVCWGVWGHLRWTQLVIWLPIWSRSSFEVA